MSGVCCKNGLSGCSAYLPTIVVSITLVANALPSTSDSAKVQDRIASALKVSSVSILNFTLTSTLIAFRRKLLAAYKWKATFNFKASKSQDEIRASLTSSTFTSMITSDVGATVDTESITIFTLSSSNTTSLTNVTNSSTSRTLGAGYIAGIVIGALCVISFIFLFLNHLRLKAIKKNQEQIVNTSTEPISTKKHLNQVELQKHPYSRSAYEQKQDRANPLQREL